MNKKIVLATGNQGKVKEMADLLSDFGFEVHAQSEFNVSEVAETGTTFIENAIIKARHAAKETGLAAIADDSGLEIDYLKGAPGIYSARYYGEGATDKLNLEKVLTEMQGVPEEQRTARFHCVLVLMRHESDPTPLVCHGKWEGRILTEASGENGFGYDPIFFVPEEGCASAELEPVRKKQLSHRGKALNELFETLKLKVCKRCRRYLPSLHRLLVCIFTSRGVCKSVLTVISTRMLKRERYLSRLTSQHFLKIWMLILLVINLLTMSVHCTRSSLVVVRQA